MYASDDELADPAKFSVRGCNGVELRRQRDEGNGPSMGPPLDNLHVSYERTSGAEDLGMDTESLVMGNGGTRHKQYAPETQKAIESILFIAEHIRKEDEEESVCIFSCSL